MFKLNKKYSIELKTLHKYFLDFFTFYHFHVLFYAMDRHKQIREAFQLVLQYKSEKRIFEVQSDYY